MNIDSWNWCARILVELSDRQRTRRDIVEHVAATSTLKVAHGHISKHVDMLRRDGYLSFSDKQVHCADENRWVSVIAITPKGRKLLSDYKGSTALAMKGIQETISILNESSVFVDNEPRNTILLESHR